MDLCAPSFTFICINALLSLILGTQTMWTRCKQCVRSAQEGLTALYSDELLYLACFLVYKLIILPKI